MIAVICVIVAALKASLSAGQLYTQKLIEVFGRGEGGEVSYQIASSLFVINS